MDKILVVLSATTGGVCIVSLATVVGAPVGIVSTGFFFSNRNNKKIVKHNKKRNKSMIKFLRWLVSQVSQAPIDMEISHEEFITILNEKDKYEKMKENVRNVSEKKLKI